MNQAGNDAEQAGATTRVDIVILAYDEGPTIADFLRHVSGQSVFDRDDLEVATVVVANGCSDDTVPRAREALVTLESRIGAWSVHDVEQKGKPNAWNLYVHDFADAGVELALFLDADIELLSHDACAMAIDALANDPHASVAVDTAVKDTALKANPSISDRLNNAAANSESDQTNTITGQFYCARMSALRRVWMPSGIIGEDGFLRAMLLTDNFRDDEDLGRIVHADGAEHSFEALTGPREFFHHQVRLTIGTITNIVLFGILREQLCRGVEPGAYVAEQNGADGAWLTGRVAEEWLADENTGARRRFLRRRLTTLGAKPWSRRLALAPVYVIATIVDLATYGVAMRRIRDGSAVGFW